MKVVLSLEHERLVRRLLGEGRFAAPEEVVADALRLYEGQAKIEPMRRAAARGLEQAAAGRCGYVTSDDVRRRSRGPR